MWSSLLVGVEEVYQARGIDGILDAVDELQVRRAKHQVNACRV